MCKRNGTFIHVQDTVILRMVRHLWNCGRGVVSQISVKLFSF